MRGGVADRRINETAISSLLAETLAAVRHPNPCGARTAAFPARR